jgi:hypothetical protein
VFAIESPQAKPTPIMSKSEDSHSVLDPALVRAARDIYHLYCQINPDRERRRQPIGVAINKLNYQGKLIFSSFPILLPEEIFMSIEQLDRNY